MANRDRRPAKFSGFEWNPDGVAKLSRGLTLTPSFSNETVDLVTLKSKSAQTFGPAKSPEVFPHARTSHGDFGCVNGSPVHPFFVQIARENLRILDRAVPPNL